jgi:hypothetical protein
MCCTTPRLLEAAVKDDGAASRVVSTTCTRHHLLPDIASIVTPETILR